ncbi:hypothetical protein CRH09_21840 [Nocardia terpenica]|uniref:Uncharacterized protein n=1 Tax=Nocardia terpenica TaxID=455432 RepID=A0A291RMW6_9NOCA|nr:hypothetical protein CRH09_21840 [Nocardia terpenica]
MSRSTDDLLDVHGRHFVGETEALNRNVKPLSRNRIHGRAMIVRRFLGHTCHCRVTPAQRAKALRFSFLRRSVAAMP